MAQQQVRTRQGVIDGHGFLRQFEGTRQVYVTRLTPDFPFIVVEPSQRGQRADMFGVELDGFFEQLFQIRKVDLDSGEITKVAGGPGGAVRPTPSPDGKKLAYVKRVRAASLGLPPPT